MVEPMTKERAYEIFGLDETADFRDLSLAFRKIRETCHPDINPKRRKEYAEALAAFDLLQREF